MARPKKQKVETVTTEEKNGEESKAPAGKTSDEVGDKENTGEETIIRILFHGSCDKLTPRGVGQLEYEIGVNDKTGEASLRIVKNESSGAFSTKWISVDDIRRILDGIDEKTFKAVVLRELYPNRSSNNHGFMAAALKAEEVLESVSGQPATLMIKGWKTLLEKVERLSKEKVDLQDQLAVGKKNKKD